jgi:DNA-directed RNA polymerase specialized sigma24 family protein
VKAPALAEVTKLLLAWRDGDGRALEQLLPLVTFDEGLAISKSQTSEVIAVDDALNALAAVDHRKARVVEMRFFGGLSVEETAAALKVSADTVTRDWRLAKAWLYGEMNKEKQNDV